MKRQHRTPRILTGSNKALKVICKPVVFEPNKPIDNGVAKVICDMNYCLRKRKYGIGLAANQIGSDLRIMLVQETSSHIFETKAVEVKINPIITSHSEETKLGREGCLSYPGVMKQIRRWEWIELSWHNVKGTECVGTYSGMEARIIQHEIDHLNGKCLVGA